MQPKHRKRNSGAQATSKPLPETTGPWGSGLARQSEAYSSRPILFWKPELDHGYFCQWYPSRFTDPATDISFNCNEQYMMYYKAARFDDKATMAAVLKEELPVKQKALGKEVKGFDAKEWDKVKFDVVRKANHLKFSSCMADPKDTFVYGPDGKTEHDEEVSLKTLLLATGDRELCEASRFDRVWGIGFDAKMAERMPREKWGLNLLGKAIMEVREELKVAEEASTS